SIACAGSAHMRRQSEQNSSLFVWRSVVQGPFEVKDARSAPPSAAAVLEFEWSLHKIAAMQATNDCRSERRQSHMCRYRPRGGRDRSRGPLAASTARCVCPDAAAVSAITPQPM